MGIKEGFVGLTNCWESIYMHGIIIMGVEYHSIKVRAAILLQAQDLRLQKEVFLVFL
jgi:hypothetical protein